MSTITVTTTPTQLCTAKVARLRSWLTFEVPAGGQRVFVRRGNDVTITTGNALEPTESNASTLFASGKPAEDAWWAVVASGTQVVSIQEGGGAEVSRGNDSMLQITRPGKSAYDLAVDEGFVGTLPEWLESITTGNSEFTFRLNDTETAILLKKIGDPNDLAQIDLNEIPA